MFSIGALSRRTRVKVPTIRYYEQIGVLDPPVRTMGNQRRYDRQALERLHFVRHARDLGFSLEAISSLIALQDHPDRSCAEATTLAEAQLRDVRSRIGRLRRLEQELARLARGCDGTGTAQDCYVLAALGDHELCGGEHSA